ncbi:50S ribosomal protein L20 [Fasciola gigantica]|uniref:50S ribosomal protein L20 n=1 Tax=Fasciola gigantica TaxID=46835 RepID=A0A504YQG4_FASGI|nr:50S ribosomal protein L20 [Fasciola gigantica]
MRLTDILCIRKIVLSSANDSWFRRNQLMKFAFAYKGRPARCHKLGINRVFKALQYMRTSRDVRKQEQSNLWTERLMIASEQCGLPSADVLCEGLGQCNIALNKNILQILAVYEPRTFAALADIAKQYHLDRGMELPIRKTTSRVITRGMLDSPIVPGNKHLYD